MFDADEEELPDRSIEPGSPAIENVIGVLIGAVMAIGVMIRLAQLFS